MPRDNKDPKVWKYFKNGDIVRDEEESVWGKTKFEIVSFHGNWYCPLVMANIVGKFHSNGKPQTCNLDVRFIKLLGAKQRPFRNVKRKVLLNLLKKGVVEAKREFMIRLNTKTF